MREKMIDKGIEVEEKKGREGGERLFMKCFGDFYASAEKLLVWRTKKCAELLAYLFSRQGEGVSSVKITDILWENKNAGSAKSLFYTTLSYLRRELAQAGFPDLIKKSGNLYYLDIEKVDSDYKRVSQIIEKGDDTKIGQKEIEELVTLYTGRYMEGMDGSWLIEYREEMECRYLKKVREFSKRLIERQQYEEAELLLKKGISIDNYSEALSEWLIICYIKMGEGKKAVKEYERIKELLDTEFGVKINKNLNKVYLSLFERE